MKKSSKTSAKGNIKPFIVSVGQKDNGNGSVFYVKSDLWITNFNEFIEHATEAKIRFYGAKVEGKYYPLCVSKDRTTESELIKLLNDHATFGQKPVKERKVKVTAKDELAQLRAMVDALTKQLSK